jgi:hypothetical protein
VNRGQSRLSFNFDRRWIYLYLVPTTLSTIPPAFVPLEAELPFEDIVTRGVQCVRTGKTEDGKSLVTMTITVRRPPRFYCRLKERNKMRRATERDFVFQRGPFQSTKVGLGCLFEVKAEYAAEKSTQGRSVGEMEAKGFIIHEGHSGPIMSIPDDLTIKVGPENRPS